MATFTNNASKTKGLAVARLVSKASGKTIGFVNVTETFAREVCKAPEHKKIPADKLKLELAKILENAFVRVEVTDLTAEIETVSATEY